MKRLQVCCSRCNGSGKIGLSPVLAKTLAAVKFMGVATIPTIHRRLRMLNSVSEDTTTTNQRVRKLIRLKLVKEVPSKGFRRYSAV